ncbi:MAG: aminoacyl-tRNA deacylase [Chloroflexota bacterium]
MAKSSQKTVGMKLLEGKKIPYEAFEYSPDQKDAVLVAEAVGHPPEQVFKTLVVQPEDSSPKSKWSLAIIPANHQLNLKKLAKVIGAKKLKMATYKQAEQRTGLQVGGISAIAVMNKGFAVYLHESANEFTHLVISAGKRGLQVKLGVDDFVKLTRAKLVQISDN